MTNENNFLNIERGKVQKNSVKQRVKNFKEFIKLPDLEDIGLQSQRCLDCGIPFCHTACPLGNFIPKINQLVQNRKWEEAYRILNRKNNFPEFTGRLCPALCEGSCTLEMDYGSVMTKTIELSVIEEAFKKGLVKPQIPTYRKDKSVAVIGSGPSGLAVAQDLNKKGINVVVYEKSDTIGGLLSLGIPDYKLEKKIIDRRVNLLKKEGITFKKGVTVGKDLKIKKLKDKFDAVCLATGFTVPRSIDADGNGLEGIYFALEYLKQQNKIDNGEKILSDKRITAKGKNVLIIGGGDTGADCLGTAIRQGAKKVKQIEIMSKPPKKRSEGTPWPYWPHKLRTNSAHKEGGKCQWNVLTSQFIGDKKVKEVLCKKVNWNKAREMKVIEESDYIIKADLVIIAAGFISNDLKEKLKLAAVEFDRKNLVRTKNHMTTVEGVFATGDLIKGPSLICRAIADGKDAAKDILKFLS